MLSYLRWICCLQGRVIVVKYGEMGTLGEEILFCRRKRVGGSAKSSMSNESPANQH
jgi:hypothetical protein